MRMSSKTWKRWGLKNIFQSCVFMYACFTEPRDVLLLSKVRKFGPRSPPQSPPRSPPRPESQYQPIRASGHGGDPGSFIKPQKCHKTLTSCYDLDRKITNTWSEGVFYILVTWWSHNQSAVRLRERGSGDRAEVREEDASSAGRTGSPAQNRDTRDRGEKEQSDKHPHEEPRKSLQWN